MILIVSTAESFDINAVFAPLHKVCALSRQSGFYMVMSFGNLKKFLNSVQKRMEIEMYILWKKYKWKLDQKYNGILSLTQLTSIVLMIAFLKRLISKPRFLIRLTLTVPSCKVHPLLKLLPKLGSSLRHVYIHLVFMFYLSFFIF